MTDMKIGDLGKKEFKISYDKLKKSVLQCELEKNKEQCKKIFKDLNIEIYDD